MIHADRANRVVLAIIGLVALSLGAGGLLAAAGVFGAPFQHRRLLDNQFAGYFSANGSWLWPSIAGVAFVITMLVIVWLVRLFFSTDRVSDITVRSARHEDAHHDDASGAGGRTTLRPAALTHALTQEIETYHGVTAARARVLGDPLDPTLAVNVTASRRADLPALIRRIQREALAHARQALEIPDLPVTLDISVTDKVTRCPARPDPGSPLTSASR